MKTRKSTYLIYVLFLLVLLPLQYGCNKDIDLQKVDEIQSTSPIEISNIRTKATVKYTNVVNGVNIGCWMLLSKSTTDRAHWNSSNIYEPITNMWKDKTSTTSSAALTRVKNHLVAVGFGTSSMHTYSYYGYIGSSYYFNAISSTYSDANFTQNNNHGRIFGPVKIGDYWVTIAAFSRETGLLHKFINFLQVNIFIAPILQGQ